MILAKDAVETSAYRLCRSIHGKNVRNRCLQPLTMVEMMSSIMSEATIEKLQDLFARFGI